MTSECLRLNYGQARQRYGPSTADRIFHDLSRARERTALVTRRQDEQLRAWGPSPGNRANGIIDDIVCRTLGAE